MGNFKHAIAQCSYAGCCGGRHKLEAHTGPGVGGGKAAEGQPLAPHKAGCVHSAALYEAKCGDGHRLVVLSQQLLDCPPQQLDRLLCMSCSWGQVTVHVQPINAPWLPGHHKIEQPTVLHKYERGQSIVSSVDWRAFDMAWLRSSKMVLRVNPGSDNRSHAVNSTAGSVPSRRRSCSLRKICIAQRYLLDCVAAEVSQRLGLASDCSHIPVKRCKTTMTSPRHNASA
jgi:hypothetical protein